MRTEWILNEYCVPSCFLNKTNADVSIEKSSHCRSLLKRGISAAHRFQRSAQCLLQDGLSATILISLLIAVGLDMTIILYAHTQPKSSGLTARLPNSDYRESRSDDKSGPKRWSARSTGLTPPTQDLSKDESLIDSSKKRSLAGPSSTQAGPNPAQDRLISDESTYQQKETNVVSGGAIVAVSNSDGAPAFYPLPLVACQTPQGLKENEPARKPRNPLRKLRHGFAKTIGWIHKSFTSDASVERSAVLDGSAVL
jgi:hypothetical protein